MSNVNTEKFEINKPSELCQVIYFENYEKGIFATLSSMQIDLMNSLMYLAKKKMLEKNSNILNFNESIIEIEIPVKDLANFLNKYEHRDYSGIVKQLYKLKKIDVMVNSLGKVYGEITFKLTSFIHTLSWTKHRETFSKKIKIGLDGEILRSLINRKKFFSKMHLAINFSMTSKYSKLLYEVLKDYEGLKSISIELVLLLGLLNTDSNNNNHSKWLYFRPNILEKSINEINEKSDIKVSYEPIKEKIEGQRKQVTKIKFNIEKQSEFRLQELGLIQSSVTNNKFYNKSKNKLNQLIKNGYKLIDEERWIETDIKKNETRYDAETRIDTWLKETIDDDRNKIYEILAKTIENCEDPMVIIDNYKIIGVFSKDAFTGNPIDTINLMNGVIADVEEEKYE